MPKRPASNRKSPKPEPTTASADGRLRLNHFIAQAGIAARRKADELISEGKVKVNGKVVDQLGSKVDPDNDIISVNGKTINIRHKQVYLLLNKPKDAITTVKDEKDRTTVLNYVKTRERVYPVGRLDRNTTGVLLLTNDGELTARLTHPKYRIERTYHVTLDNPLQKQHAAAIAAGGIDIGKGAITGKAELSLSKDDPRDCYISIREGKYHEIKRLFAEFGYDVKKLDRVSFAGITHSGMKRGDARTLKPSEVRALKKLVGLARERD
jgi:23S rRNA pseudouridine2605 synthase